MKIIITRQSARINKIIRENKHELSETEMLVLTHLRDSFLKNAKSSAFSWPPQGQTLYPHHEVIESPLVESLSAKVIRLLAEVDITFRKKHGTWAHTVYGIFEVDKS